MRARQGLREFPPIDPVVLEESLTDDRPRRRLHEPWTVVRSCRVPQLRQILPHAPGDLLESPRRPVPLPARDGRFSPPAIHRGSRVGHWSAQGPGMPVAPTLVAIATNFTEPHTNPGGGGTGVCASRRPSGFGAAQTSSCHPASRSNAAARASRGSSKGSPTKSRTRSRAFPVRGSPVSRFNGAVLVGGVTVSTRLPGERQQDAVRRRKLARKARRKELRGW